MKQKMKQKMMTDNIKTLEDLRRRKAQLRLKINAQRTEILTAFDHIKADLNPTQLLKSAVTGMLDNSEESHDLMKMGINRSVSTFASGFISNPKTATIVRFLMPLAIQFAPKIMRFVKESVPKKARFYGFLRERVGRLREQLN